MNRVFVYGILQTGAGTRGTVPGVLHDLGAFPAVTQLGSDEAGHVHGEILEVGDIELLNFDRIEGHPTFYQRKQVEATTADGPVQCWCYELQVPLPGRAVLLPEGRWVLPREQRRTILT